jgi:dTDP-4-amino-4,6-dideoxygalactose transaminase
MEKLALLGGTPVRKKKYPPHVTTGEEEKREVLKVLEKGILSAYEGANTEYFLGGEQAKTLEKTFEKRFKVKHAIAVNSAASGLAVAVGAAGIGPGNEVIVTPWTMTATAAAILVNNAIPIFCDITEDTFNLDPAAIEKSITEKTKAILVVHISGHPADMDEIMEVAREHDLIVIEDAAQVIGGLYKGKYTGTIGDLGVYSFNSNKIIQCGEGGMVVTDDDELALRSRLIRNHAEAVIATGMKVKSLVNMLGWNYRMNEIEAAIVQVQLRRLDGFLKKRRALIDYLNRKLRSIDGITTPIVKKGCTHTYYQYDLKIDKSKIPISVNLLLKALNAEGMDFLPGYKPLYMQPLYQKMIVYGNRGCPFTCSFYGKKIKYTKGLCPTAESIYKRVILTEAIRPSLGFRDMDEIYMALRKVLDNIDKLKKLDTREKWK